jgi:NADH:ubiquinone oxidoreductase subunit 4 (subunit M)
VNLVLILIYLVGALLVAITDAARNRLIRGTALVIGALAFGGSLAAGKFPVFPELLRATLTALEGGLIAGVCGSFFFIMLARGLAAKSETIGALLLMASAVFGLFAATRAYALAAALLLWVFLAVLVRLRGLEERNRALRALAVAAAVSLGFGIAGILREQPSWIYGISLIALLGAFPLHFWLPQLMPEAPFLGSTLSPILVSRCAAAACLRFYPAEPNAAFAVLGLVGAVWCGCASFAAGNLREKLGYFAGVHASLALWAIGKGSPELAALILIVTLPGIILWGLGSSILFDRLKYIELERLRGIGAHLPRMNVLFILGALGIALFPGTSAFAALIVIVEKTETEGEVWRLGAAVVLLFLAAGSTYFRLAFGEVAEDLRRAGDLNRRELSAVIPLGCCVAAGLVPPLVSFLRGLLS